MHEHFRREVVHRYHATQKREVCAFLRRALEYQTSIKRRAINQCVIRASR